MALKLDPVNMLCNSLELKLDLLAGDLTSFFPAACFGKVDQGQEELIPPTPPSALKNDNKKKQDNSRPRHEEKYQLLDDDQ